MSDIIVLESPEYGEEARSLASDPIIGRMAAELAFAGFSSRTVPYGHDSTVPLAEYKRLGGNAHRSIGGPARAIAILLDAIEEELANPSG